MPEQFINDLQRLLASVRSQLEYLQDLGFENQELNLEEKKLLLSKANIPNIDETLESIRADLGNCRRCGLSSTRKKIVFGFGNPSAHLVFVGEAPGREEDLVGDPFVGEAGKLLDKILLAIGLRRKDVYICNVLKCRPPQNRDPQSEEVSICEGFLKRQIDVIKPQVIVGLGRFAVQSLLKSTIPISRLRGEWQNYQGIPFMPTYHPAYLLRNPDGKRDVWEDMKEVKRRLDSLTG